MKNIKRLLSFLISLIIMSTCGINLFAYDIGVSPKPKERYLSGLKWDSPEDVEPYLIYDDNLRNTTLPSFVDNSYLYPTPMRQTQEDCVGWAVAYAQMSALQTLNRNWTVNNGAHKFSPTFTYNLINDGQNKPTSIFEAMKNARDIGICPITYYGFEKSYSAQVYSKEREAASLYKASSFYSTTNLNQIKQAIAEGKGVVMGVCMGDDLTTLSANNAVYDSKIGRTDSGHAICLVGYDDSERIFKFINSWGTGWGVNGYGWITYDFVADTEINRNGANRGYVLNYSSTVDYVMGDANLDNTITAADGRLALRFSASVENPTDRQFVLSDVDGSGTLSAADARNILNYSAGNLTKFPLYE